MRLEVSALRCRVFIQFPLSTSGYIMLAGNLSQNEMGEGKIKHVEQKKKKVGNRSYNEKTFSYCLTSLAPLFQRKIHILYKELLFLRFQNRNI